MYLTQYTIRSNYLMSSEELQRWQTNTIICCEFDNMLNSIMEDRRQTTDEFEESAINTAISTHGLQQHTPFTASNPVHRQAQPFQNINDDRSFFDEQAINAAIEQQGIRIPLNR